MDSSFSRDYRALLVSHLVVATVAVVCAITLVVIIYLGFALGRHWASLPDDWMELLTTLIITVPIIIYLRTAGPRLFKCSEDLERTCEALPGFHLLIIISSFIATGASFFLAEYLLIAMGLIKNIQPRAFDGIYVILLIASFTCVSMVNLTISWVFDQVRQRSW